MQTKNINVDQLTPEEFLELRLEPNALKASQYFQKMGQLDQLVFMGNAPPLPPRATPLVFTPISPENFTAYYMSGSGAAVGAAYKPVPPPRPLGGSRPAPPGPPSPLALPGAAPALHTHSAKFPIEREVILRSGDKECKIPVLQEYRRRQDRVSTVAPDAPRRQDAWTMDIQNRQAQAGPAEGFRHAGTSRGGQPHQDAEAGNPPVPLKQTFIYGSRADCKYEDMPNGGSQSISTPDAGKESTKESKITSKSVTKTYHTLKDMISSRFKGKDSNENESKSNDPEVGLNNVTEELRKSMRDRAEQEANNAAANISRDASRKTPGEQGIYGRPVPQQRTADIQYTRHLMQIQQMQNNSVPGQYQMQQFSSPLQQSGGQTPNQIMTQQQFLQQQIMMNQQQHLLGHGPGASSTPQQTIAQARSQELLTRQNMNTDVQNRPHSQIVQQLGTADNIYYQPQYGVTGTPQQRTVGRVINNYPSDSPQHNSNYSGLKQVIAQVDNDSRANDVRSPQQMEREIVRQRGLTESRRTASQPQLPLDEEESELGHDRVTPTTPTAVNKGMPLRRGSHGNLIETLSRTGNGSNMEHEKDSDDGGFRSRLNAQGRSFDSRDRVGTSGLVQQNIRSLENEMRMKNDPNGDVIKSDGIYGGMKTPVFNGIPQNGEDLGNANVRSKKVNPGSTASSDYDKNGGLSSNVDSGRGSAAYSSGRHVGHDTSTESDPLPGTALGRNVVGTSEQVGSSNKMYHEKNGHAGDSEWVDIVESELRQILEPKLHGLSLGSGTVQNGNPGPGSETPSSVTPPLPPLTPTHSTPDATPRNSARFKHQSLPYGTKPEYSAENRGVMPNQRAGWQHTPKHRSSSSKKQDHSMQYKKQMFGLETDITSTTTRSLDLSSMLDGQSDSDVSTQDARAIRRQLQGLENMYCEVLKLLGVRKPANHGLGKYQPSDPRLSKQRYGSVSSLPSSSVSSRPVRDKRRNATEQRKKVNDIKGINKRFQRLESHVVTLARSVAHLSSEMRTQHLMIQEMENIRGEITALRNQQRSQSMPRMDNSYCPASNGFGGVDASSLANPSRVKKLTKFFGDEPPLLRMFLKKLGYEKYAPLLEKERVGAAELPFLGEERLRALGVPLGPRLRILHEARLALPPSNTSHTTLCIV